MDWQTYAAAAIVAITLAIFVFRMNRRKKGKPGCGGGCCDKSGKS
jgi:hypothetical protein